MTESYIVATIKSWNIENFAEYTKNFAGEWHLITDKDDLTLERIKAINPRYIFFPHWSWIVPKDILDAAECVCFHMTDVPYGRGGSPLQNLIVRGHKDTKITALRMSEAMDAGPVYMKKDLSLEGSAEEIFKRASHVIFAMMGEMVEQNPEPIEQTGEVTEFVRRKPEESRIPENADLETIYDYIRMLDAEGYPKAFMDYGDFRLVFDSASMQNGSVTAKVEFKRKDDE